jgi:uncharacterized damage-inducible protein DinB
MNPIDSILAELLHEAATTRIMLERVPQESLAWKPHEKSRTLGEIASHIANLPGVFLATLGREEFDRHEYQPGPNATVADIVATFDRCIANALAVLPQLTTEQLLGKWRYKYGERVIFEMPRLAVLRAMGLNHLIHHRGQLSVYLRLLNVSLPPVYGPTADEAARP